MQTVQASKCSEKKMLWKIPSLIHAALLTKEYAIIYKEIIDRKILKSKSQKSYVEGNQSEIKIAEANVSLRKKGVVKWKASDQTTRGIQKMANKFQKLIEHPSFYYYDPDNHQPNRLADGKCHFMLNYSFEIYYDIRSFVSINFGSFFRNYFKGDYRIEGFHLHRKTPLTKGFLNKEAYSNYWHYDGRRQDTSWILLTVNLNDTEKQAGFRTFDRETSNELNRQGFKWPKRYEESTLSEFINEKKIVYGNGPVGTCTIVDAAHLLHRSGEPRSRTHRDVAFIFVGSGRPWETAEVGGESSVTRFSKVK